MLGYGVFSQITAGMMSRLRARAFIFEGPSRTNSSTINRVVYVTINSGLMFHSVKQGVVDGLQKLYGDIYTYDNVIISSEHTHSGPAGYSYYLLYNLFSQGYLEDNFKIIVNGIISAIKKSHETMSKGGRILINKGELLDASVK